MGVSDIYIKKIVMTYSHKFGESVGLVFDDCKFDLLGKIISPNLKLINTEIVQNGEIVIVNDFDICINLNFAKANSVVPINIISVGGSVRVNVENRSIAPCKITFPKLTTVNDDFRISGRLLLVSPCLINIGCGLYVDPNSIIYLPTLKAIGGVVSLEGSRNSHKLTALELIGGDFLSINSSEIVLPKLTTIIGKWHFYVWDSGVQLDSLEKVNGKRYSSNEMQLPVQTE